MNKLSRGLIGAIGVIGLGWSQAVLAVDNPTPVLASATFDWSQLQLSITPVTDTVPTVVFSNYNTSLSSSSTYAQGSENHSATRTNWSSTAQTDATAGGALANGLASSEIFSGTANAVGAGSTSNASGSRTLEFSFDGPGVLTVSVPYTISLSGTGLACCNSDTASVTGNASFNSFTGGANFYTNSNISFSLDNFAGSSLPSRAGNLVFGIVASDAGTGSLSVNFNAAAHGVGVVPEPESYAMLLAGLGLVAAVVRRRSRKVAD